MLDVCNCTGGSPPQVCVCVCGMTRMWRPESSERKANYSCARRVELRKRIDYGAKPLPTTGAPCSAVQWSYTPYTPRHTDTHRPIHTHTHTELHTDTLRETRARVHGDGCIDPCGWWMHGAGVLPHGRFTCWRILEDPAGSLLRILVKDLRNVSIDRHLNEWNRSRDPFKGSQRRRGIL